MRTQTQGLPHPIPQQQKERPKSKHIDIIWRMENTEVQLGQKLLVLKKLTEV